MRAQYNGIISTFQVEEGSSILSARSTFENNMILNRNDALYAANVFVDYFDSFGRIDDYLRKVKLERMSNYPTSLPGMGPQDDMFNDFSSQ